MRRVCSAVTATTIKTATLANDTPMTASEAQRRCGRMSGESVAPPKRRKKRARALTYHNDHAEAVEDAMASFSCFAAHLQVQATVLAQELI